MRRFLYLIVTLLIGVGVAATVMVTTESGQDLLIERAVTALVAAPPSAPPEGGMRVFMCGTSSPIPNPDRAQACVAVQVDDRLYVVDAGAGSANVLALGNLPLDRLQAILLTHFHSDHIAAINDINLISWAGGRPHALPLVGPEGVDRVAAGFNEAYALDRGYRQTHHGADFMPAEYHLLMPRTIEPGVVLEEDGLRVLAFTVDHSPVAPAVGYRFEYGGRSVAITGDTVINDAIVEAVDGVDLLLSDALSLPIVGAMERGSRAAGRDRNAHILADIQDYHASADSLAELAGSGRIGQLALYHLVPAPRNAVMANTFLRDLPGGVVLTEDGMIFDLPAGGGIVTR